MRAVSLAHVEIGTDPVELFARHERSHETLCIKGIADGKLRRLCGELLDELVINLLLHKHARPGNANLPRQKTKSSNRRGKRLFNIGVCENDVRGFSAQFQRDPLQVSCRCLQNQAADIRRARKRHFVDSRMRSNGRTCCLTKAGDDIDDAGRHTCLEDQFAQPYRRERRLFGRLQDRRVSASQRRRNLPCGHTKRAVPGNNLPTNAQRFAQGKIEHPPVGRVCLAIQFGWPACIVPKYLRNVRHRRAREGDRRSVVQRFELRELLGVPLHEVRNFQQIGTPHVRIHAGPVIAFKRAAGRRNGSIHVGGVSFRRMADDIFSRRIDGTKSLARLCIQPLVANQKFLGRALQKSTRGISERTMVFCRRHAIHFILPIQGYLATSPFFCPCSVLNFSKVRWAAVRLLSASSSECAFRSS